MLATSKANELLLVLHAPAYPEKPLAYPENPLQINAAWIPAAEAEAAVAKAR